jgi:replicative DNA helicase
LRESKQESDSIRQPAVYRKAFAQQSDCYDHREEVDALLDRVEQQIFSLTKYNVQIDLRPTKELVMDAIQKIEKLYENRGSITGLPTGFVELDRMTSGLQAWARQPSR